MKDIPQATCRTPRRRLPWSCRVSRLDAEYTGAEIEFMLAVDAYKRKHRRPHPSPAEVLAIARALGYRKVKGEPS